jgi:hypothetical protein
MRNSGKFSDVLLERGGEDQGGEEYPAYSKK